MYNTVPSLQGIPILLSGAKHTKPTLKPNFTNRGEAGLMSTIENYHFANKEPFRPSLSNVGLRGSANLIDKQIEYNNR